MYQNDNWGDRARIGMFIVGNEAVPEAEWWAMAPPNVSVHAARVTAKAPWATWHADGADVELCDDLIRGARQFAAMRLSAVVVGHSSSSFLGGKGWDEKVSAKLAAILGPEISVSTNGLDTMAALRASMVEQPFLVLPAWFDDRIVGAGRRYYEDHDFALAGLLQYDPGPAWREVPPAKLYPRGFGFEQDVKSLFGQIVAACPDHADGVLIAGTGFRCVAILEALEQELGRPVISANQASLWYGLRQSAAATNIADYGKLLRT